MHSNYLFQQRRESRAKTPANIFDIRRANKPNPQPGDLITRDRSLALPRGDLAEGYFASRPRYHYKTRPQLFADNLIKTSSPTPTASRPALASAARRPLTCVDVGVLLHVGLLVEPFAAVLTGVWPGVGVDEEVGRQGGAPLERLPALLAAEHPLVVVDGPEGAKKGQTSSHDPRFSGVSSKRPHHG